MSASNPSRIFVKANNQPNISDKDEAMIIPLSYNNQTIDHLSVEMNKQLNMADPHMKHTADNTGGDGIGTERLQMIDHVLLNEDKLTRRHSSWRSIDYNYIYNEYPSLVRPV
jgi:tRNA U34 5-carboxymethylaminomethyl modifying enzyme MnmG/GidA